MKNKIYIVIIFVLVFVICLLSFVIIRQNKELNSNEKEKAKEVSPTPLESGEEKKVFFDKLSLYGEEILLKYDYKSFNKLDNIYFLSLNELSTMGYDISMFKSSDGTVCDKDKTGIFFDDEYKLYERELGIVVPVIYKCFKEELSN